MVGCFRKNFQGEQNNVSRIEGGRRLELKYSIECKYGAPYKYDEMMQNDSVRIHIV